MNKFEIDCLAIDLEQAQAAFDRVLKVSGIGSEYAAALRVGLRDVSRAFHAYNSALDKRE